MEPEKHWITLAAGSAVSVVAGALLISLIVRGALLPENGPAQPDHDRMRVAVAFR